jgi:hypothetical protein
MIAARKVSFVDSPTPNLYISGRTPPNPRTGTNLSIAVDHKIKKPIEASISSIPSFVVDPLNILYFEYLFGYQLKE